MTKFTSTVSHVSAEHDARIQRRKDAFVFFQSKENRTWPKLNAYKETDKSWFPTLVHKLATQGLISGRILDKALDAAWVECGQHTLVLSQWAELNNLAYSAVEDTEIDVLCHIARKTSQEKWAELYVLANSVPAES